MRHPSRATVLGAGSALALGVPLLTTFIAAAANADPGDLQTLNAALALERAAIKAYNDAAATGLLDAHVREVAAGFIADHTAHRDALIAAIKAGGATPSENVFALDYPPLKSQADILRFAMAVEAKAASTYLSVIPDLKDRALAQAAASILGVETTHVSTLALALGAARPYAGGFVK